MVQRVEVEIAFFRDEACVVTYHGRYWEYFQLGDDPAEERIDTHDFDVRRDGWGPSAIKRMLRRYRVQDPRGAGRVEVEKRFHLGIGQVDDPQPAHTTDAGGAFGFLTQVGDAVSEARVELGDGRTVPSPHVSPFGAIPTGTGSWEGPQWQAHERFRYRLATLHGRVETDGYQPAEGL